MGTHAVLQTPPHVLAHHRGSSPHQSSPHHRSHPHHRVFFPALLPRRSFPSLRIAAAASPPPLAVVVHSGKTLYGRSTAFPDLSHPSSSSPSSSMMFAPVLKGGYGAYGSVTLERSKLDTSKKSKKSSPETAIGGGGGDIGKKINHGGGDGGDDGGDDDDYFGEFDEGDEGDEGGLFRKRLAFQELFDRKFVDAVLQEWYKTMSDLPAGLRQACEMGLVSSAQLVHFLAINARPTTSRLISRVLPQSVSRAFIGRMIADPSFLYKLLLEQATTLGCSLWWELKTRKERIKQEWDLALINILAASACNAFVVWSLAPCRSYGNTFRFDLQNTIQKLPNNIFEKCYPLREFDLQKRIHSFFYRGAEFCLVGLTVGSLQGAISKVSSLKKGGRLSVTFPTHNTEIGETSRLAWLGVEADPLLLQSDNLLKAYSRPSDAADRTPSSNWFISKDAIVSGLGLLGIRLGSGEPEETAASNCRRKRTVRRKISKSLA